VNKNSQTEEIVGTIVATDEDTVQLIQLEFIPTYPRGDEEYFSIDSCPGQTFVRIAASPNIRGKGKM
jgi:hypothetical protein